jgi:hypothetical protein
MCGDRAFLIKLCSRSDEIFHHILRPVFAGAAPIQVKQDVDISLAALDLRDVRLVHFKAMPQLRLREASGTPNSPKVLSQHFVSTMVNG